MNSDDYYLPGSLRWGRGWVLSSGAGLVFGNILIVGESGQLLRENRFVPFSPLSLCEGMPLTSHLLLDKYCPR